MREFAALGMITAIILVACGEPADEPATTLETHLTSTTTSVEEPTSVPPSASPEPAVEAAIKDLSRRLGVPGDVIELITTEPVTWSDGSLGCPEPDQAYTQALVEGHQIVLGVDGRLFDYRSGLADEPRLCPSPEKDGGYDFVPSPRFDD